MSINIWNELNHFTPMEFISPNEMSYDLLRVLDSIRADAGLAIKITSSYRAGSGEHGQGLAVDISDNLEGEPMGSRWRFKVLRSIIRNGICRIGFYDRHFHIGISKEKDQDVCWWAESS